MTVRNIHPGKSIGASAPRNQSERGSVDLTALTGRGLEDIERRHQAELDRLPQQR
jgi:hypothetical protein